MAETQHTYIPAAGHDWSLPLYDPLVKVMGGDAIRRRLIDQAELRPDHRVLEVGCGTGTLLMSTARAHPGVQLTGLDPDPTALDRARRKADSARVPIQLDRGFSDALPYADASFDRVFSALMFHHLADADQKLRTFREIRRVLKPGGRLHLVDFARPDSTSGRHLIRLIHANHRLNDNAPARVLSLMRDAGLDDARHTGSGRMMLLISLAYYQSRR
jgi:ubiquinone/menaquinone biosynthesis C-methylase UbiE